MANPEIAPASKGAPHSIFPYPILCEGKGCGQPAVYKVASRWSDDFTWEWKTYGLVCCHCLEALYKSALQRHKACMSAPGETLDRPVVLELAPGQSSGRMVRRADLEPSLVVETDHENPRETGV